MPNCLRFVSHFILTFLLFLSAASQESGIVRLLGSFNGSSGGIYISGSWGWTDSTGREYAILGNSCGTSIVEVTNPTAIVERGFINGPCSGWREIQVHDHYAYVVSEGGGGTQIIDLSPLPSPPVLKKNFVYSQSGKNTTYAHSIHIMDGFMYLNGCGNWSPGGVVMFSLADPLNPLFLSSYDRNYVHDCFVRGNTLYAAGIYGEGAQIVNITNKLSPQLTYSISYAGAGTHNMATTEDGRYLLTTDEIGSTPKTLKIWNLQTPPSFPKVAEYSGNPSGIVHNVFVRGDVAYMSYYADGLKVVDISNPAAPVELGGYDTSTEPVGTYEGSWSVYPFFPSGNIAVTDQQNGLFMVDLNFDGPKNPSAVSAYSDYETPQSVTLRWTDPTLRNSESPFAGLRIHIYRDGSFLAAVDSGVGAYTDDGLTIHQLYEYSIRAVIPAESSSVVTVSAYAGGHAQPEGVTGFAALDGTDGVHLTWTNPSTQMDGTPLNDLAAIEIYRDGSLVASVLQGPSDSGQSRMYVDSVIGYHYYEILARDSETPSYASEASATLQAYGGMSGTYEQDFETGIGPGYISGTWDTTHIIAAGGTAALTESPDGNYPLDSDSYFLAPPIIVRENMVLRFRHIAAIAGGDFAFVERSTNHNKTFSTMKVYNWFLNADWSDGVLEENDWVEESFSLAAFVGDTISFRFRFQSNPPTVADGWYIDDLRIGYGSPYATVEQTVNAGWNMLSVPVDMAPQPVVAVFPPAASGAFAYEGSYVRKTNLSATMGYWMKFDSAETFSHTGLVIAGDSAALRAGWNMIGSATTAVEVADLYTVPEGLLESQFYEYDGSYLPSESIEPGKAYWVKSSGQGVLILGSLKR